MSETLIRAIAEIQDYYNSENASLEIQVFEQKNTIANLESPTLICPEKLFFFLHDIFTWVKILRQEPWV